MKKMLKRFLRNERGTIAVMSGVIAVASLGALAVGIDSASLYFEKRKAQGAVDLAAIAAARGKSRAVAAANATINDHQLPSVQQVVLVTGSYSPDPAVAPDQRFVPNGNPVNAVRVELHNRAPLYFGRAVSKDGTYEVVTRATAVSSAAAAFSVGSRLLSLNGGVLNGVLSGMLGGNVSLTAMDYNALASYNVDLFRFSDTLATKVNGKVGTYDELIKSKATVGNVLDTLAEVARREGGQPTALAALQLLGASSDARNLNVPLGQFLNFGAYGPLAIGEAGTAFSARANAMAIIAAAAQVANGARQAEVIVNLGLPGLISLQLGITIGERPQNSPWIGIGEREVKIYTAQTRVRLIAEAGGSGLLGSAKVKLPFYLDLAAAEAKLNNVTCGPDPLRDARVTVNVTPALLDAWIGEPSLPKEWAVFYKKPNIVAAPLVSALANVEVNGRAHAAVTNLRETPLTFDWSDIAAIKPRTARTRDFSASLVQSLLNDLQLSVKVGPLSLLTPTLLTGAVTASLMPVTKILDGVLNDLLGVLGIGLGEADVWVHGVRCDGAVLVN
jgi:uncharacterized membrane protein